MKNYESLEKELEAIAPKAGEPAIPDQRELHSLCEMLRAASSQRQRSSQHQEWAWTRCRAQMEESPSQPSFWLLFNRNMRWLGTGIAAGLVLMFGLPYLDKADTGPLPVVTANADSTISAVPFHSPKANADVIWVSGYNYLPASHTIR